jgi:hypothetical protein
MKLYATPTPETNPLFILIPYHSSLLTLLYHHAFLATSGPLHCPCSAWNAIIQTSLRFLPYFALKVTFSGKPFLNILFKIVITFLFVPNLVSFSKVWFS